MTLKYPEQPPALRAASDPPEQVVDASSGHILVVDDNQQIRNMLALLLERQGHTVSLAENGRQALEMLRTESFDLMLLDIMMPEMDGFQVLEHKKHDSTLRAVPVIVISAKSAMDGVVRCIDLGAEDYLTKPFDRVLLKARIGACLEKKRLRDQEQAYLKQLQIEREAVRQRNHALALLNRLSQELSSILDVQQVTQQLPRSIAEIVDAEGVSLWLWDEEREGWLVCRAAFHPKLKHLSLAGLRLRPGEGIAGWVAQQAKSVIVPRAQDDPRFFPGIDEQIGFHTTSLLAVPLRIRHAVIGVVEVANKLKGDFDTHDLALIEALTTSAAIAIDNAVLFEARHQLVVELKERNEELDAFAHTVAHDLKGALNNVIGYTSVTKDGHDNMSKQQLCDHLDMISQSGFKTASIVDELLLLSSVRKLEEVAVGALDMAGIVAQAQERLAFMIEEHQAEIVLPESWPVVLGYGPWVEEVWANYLSNALKYGGQPPRVELGFDILDDSETTSEELETCLSTRSAEGIDDSSPATRHSMVRFWVRDNGPGLPPEEQARLFTPFQRLHQVRAKGHGLGLSIVQRIVEKLGGRIGVESQPGHGSVFSFTLPRD